VLKNPENVIRPNKPYRRCKSVRPKWFVSYSY